MFKTMVLHTMVLHAMATATAAAVAAAAGKEGQSHEGHVQDQAAKPSRRRCAAEGERIFTYVL